MARFPFVAVDNNPTSLMPRMPLLLSNGDYSLEVTGLLDTGSAVNVLPYPIGLALGAVWEEQTIAVPLVGSLGRYEARALVVFALHPDMDIVSPVRLVFAWRQAENAPVILGQMNFFMEFDVCFYRSQNFFEVQRKA